MIFSGPSKDSYWLFALRSSLLHALNIALGTRF